MHWSAEKPGELIGARLGAVHQPDLGDPAIEQSPQHAARRAARAKHHCDAVRHSPSRGKVVEIAQETVGVGIGGVQHAFLQPQRVGRADAARDIVHMSGGR